MQVFNSKFGALAFTCFSLLFLKAVAPLGYIRYREIALFLAIFLFCYIVTSKFRCRAAVFLALAITLLFSLSDLIAQRLGGWYFHDVPLEFISIVLATNWDEIRNTCHFVFREYAIFSLIILNVILFFLVHKAESTGNSSFKSTASHVILMGGVIILFISVFPPARKTVCSLVDAVPVIEATGDRILARKSFTWGATDVGEPERTVVVFLGETHRWDKMSINGYLRETTPLLATQNLVTFRNTVSQATSTLSSTPMILSRKTVYDRGIYPEKSVIAAFREVGFETWYVSYLQPAHIGDTEINLIANDAEHYVVSSVNIQTLEKILSASAKKKLIVYKTVGAHYLFHTRYPKDFEYFKPSHTSVSYKVPKPVPEDIRLLENSYDNAVRYSLDYQVNAFINVLKKRKEPVLFCFIADHGTAIYEDGKSLYGGSTRPNYSIGYFFWFNPAYERGHHQDIAFLKSNTRKAISSEIFVDTILDLSDIRTPKRKGKTLVVKDYVETPRSVLAGGKVVDYDSLPPKNHSDTCAK